MVELNLIYHRGYINYAIIKLNKYPVNTIPNPAIVINTTRSLGFNTLLKRIISGMLNAVTAIIKESDVPIATPALVSSLTSGITPAAFE